MMGRRIEWNPEAIMGPGEYAKLPDGLTWYATTPNGLLGNLRNHDVTEHEDGTISASPSILVEGGGGAVWHGYLERGVWRQD